jgi:hypothetical protein
MFIP